MKPSTISFKLPTVEVCKHWAVALQNDTSWNDFVIGVMKDKVFKDANEDFFNPPDGFGNPAAYEKCIGWAKMTHNTKEEAYQLNQAQCKLYSDKLLQKLNNLRSRDQFKKNGKALDRPHSLDSRWGISRSSGRKAIEWDDILSLFDKKDFADR